MSGQTFHAPTHMVVFYALAGVCLIITLLPLAVRRDDLSFGRKCWWGGTAGAALFALLGSLPQLGGGLALAAAFVFASTLNAFFTSSYIKIGGKIYAFHTYDAEPDHRTTPLPSDTSASGLPEGYASDVTNAKMWWLLVGTATFCTGAIGAQFLGAPNWAIVTAVAVVFLLIAGGFGVLDARAGHRVAREQVVQFALISVLSLGVFPLLYLPAFALARPRR